MKTACAGAPPIADAYACAPTAQDPCGRVARMNMTPMMVRERTARLVRTLLIAAPLLVGLSTTARAQISVGVELPSVRIGVNFDTYPDMVVIPGYPVYYDPQADANYFFYDGDYWIFRDDIWYTSGWYNGPWRSVDPDAVPLYLLRVPVRYYRQPPSYFRGWGEDAAPRWGEHWGHQWDQRHSGWDRWNRGSSPRAAPLPVYQRQYTGGRYPDSVARQRVLQSHSGHGPQGRGGYPAGHPAAHPGGHPQHTVRGQHSAPADARTPQRQPVRQHTYQAQPAYQPPSHAPQGRPNVHTNVQHAPQGRPNVHTNVQHAPQGRPNGNRNVQHAPQGRPNVHGNVQHAPQGRPNGNRNAQHAPPQ